MMEASFKAAKELHAEVVRDQCQLQEDLRVADVFSNNGYQWFQVAEIGYDNFMARHSQS